MYSFDARVSRRRNKWKNRILWIVIFILVLLLIGVSYSWMRTRSFSTTTQEVLVSRAISEAADAQSAAYRLTQSSGSNSTALLAEVQSHIYCLSMLNTLTSNIYGAGTVVVEPTLLSDCIETLDSAFLRLSSGNVMTALYTTLRDQVNEVAATFSL